MNRSCSIIASVTKRLLTINKNAQYTIVVLVETAITTSLQLIKKNGKYESDK